MTETEVSAHACLQSVCYFGRKFDQSISVFDRQQGDEKLYKEIHAEFASLIDTLVSKQQNIQRNRYLQISCFCEDMEVTTEKLAEALQGLSHQMLTVKERVRFMSI